MPCMHCSNLFHINMQTLVGHLQTGPGAHMLSWLGVDCREFRVALILRNIRGHKKFYSGCKMCKLKVNKVCPVRVKCAVGTIVQRVSINCKINSA